MDRRHAIGLGVMTALMSRTALAQTMGPDGYLPGDSTEFVKLWPGTPPGGEGVNHTLKVTDTVQPDGFHVRAISQIEAPGFFVYRPAQPNGLGLLIIPGGGYAAEGGDRGGREIAQHFSALGITCFVLRYRLPGEGWANRSEVPLQDAQRAMRLIKSQPAKYGIESARLAAIGFSAGGHLSAMLAIRHADRTYPAVDAADTLDAKPLVTVHMYPVITMGGGAHPGSRDKLLGDAPSAEAVARYSLDKHITADTAPSFIALPADDEIVPPFPNGIAFYEALQVAKVPSQLHVFEVGGHGFSLHWTIGKPAAAWPSLFLAWAATHGFKA
jgi:acetyl esterase/lipase